MLIWKRKQKIHLSPRLADSIGQRTLPEKTTGERIIIASVLIILALVILNTKSSKNGEILGVQNAKPVNYRVKEGDTLTELSARYNVYWMTIVEENELTAPYELLPGQTLRIPNQR